jgi:hypothetical protein
MRTFNKTVASSLALNANLQSDYIPLKNIFMYSIAAVVTGTPTGTIRIQASNDPETNDTQINTTSLTAPAVGPTNWVDIANSSFPLSAAGETMWNVRDVAYNYVRVVYVDSSGGASDAVATIIFNGKGM